VWSDYIQTVDMNCDGYSAGTYNYTLLAIDETGNYGKWTTLVIVLANGTTTTPTTTSTTSTTPYTGPDLLIYLSWGITMGSLVVIVVFSMLIYRARKMGQ
jgi:hypothetical protein